MTAGDRHAAQPRGRRARRQPPERLAAWLFTGPLGHLYGTAADVAVYVARGWRERAARRLHELARFGRQRGDH